MITQVMKKVLPSAAMAELRKPLSFINRYHAAYRYGLANFPNPCLPLSKEARDYLDFFKNNGDVILESEIFRKAASEIRESYLQKLEHLDEPKDIYGILFKDQNLFAKNCIHEAWKYAVTLGYQISFKDPTLKEF